MHTHITNTRIGDVEILERRYPVMIHRFGLRSGSGGAGKWRGGDGVVREIEFIEPMQVSILSEVSCALYLNQDNRTLIGSETCTATLRHGRGRPRCDGEEHMGKETQRRRW